MIGSVIPFAGASCRVETSQLICSENHVTGFCMLRVILRSISEWNIVRFNSFEQLSEEYSGISICRELFYKNNMFYNIGLLFYMYYVPVVRVIWKCLTDFWFQQWMFFFVRI